MLRAARFAFVGVMLTALCSSAMAQAKLTVPNNLVAGDNTVLSYSDPSQAGQTVTVKISGGYPPMTIEVYIHLDQKGNGTTTWEVPDWMIVHFNASGMEEITRSIR